MATKKKFNIQHLAIIVVALLLVVSTIINFSMAYFTNSTSATSSDSGLTLGTIAVNARVENTVLTDNEFSISADEVAMKAPLYKFIVLENLPNTQTQDFYMRVKLSFYNDDEVSELASFTLASAIDIRETHYGSNYSSGTNYNASNWKKGTDNKYYYNNSVSIIGTEGKVYIPVKITFAREFGQDNFDSPYVQFELEIIQSANNGYTGWTDTDRPASWPVNN